MKKRKLLIVVLSFMLLFNLAWAIEMRAEAKEDEKVTLLQDARSMKRSTLEPIIAKPMFYSTTQVPEYTAYTLDPYYYYYTPITAEYTGWVYVDYILDRMNFQTYDDKVTIEIVDEENLRKFTDNPGGADYESIGYSFKRFSTNEEVIDYEKIYMNKGDSYYVLAINWSPNSSATVGCRAKLFTTGQRTLNQGTSKWTTVSSINKDKETKATWFKVKPDRTGVMSVSLKCYGYDNNNGYVTLYNKDKKVLSDKVYYSDKKVNFGVKKNVTYYIKVENCYGSYTYNYKIGVKYGMTERTDRAIGTKDKAKTLKRKADATNTLFVASRSTSTDWYKFKVTSKRETVISFNASTIRSGTIKLTVYCGKKKIGEATVYPGDSGDYYITNGTTWQKANAGTYYVKVVKDKKASGKYSIRYKK